MSLVVNQWLESLPRWDRCRHQGCHLQHRILASRGAAMCLRWHRHRWVWPTYCHSCFQRSRGGWGILWASTKKDWQPQALILKNCWNIFSVFKHLIPEIKVSCSAVKGQRRPQDSGKRKTGTTNSLNIFLASWIAIFMRLNAYFIWSFVLLHKTPDNMKLTKIFETWTANNQVCSE